MLVPNQQIEIRWSTTNVEHYKSKGYNYTKFGDSFLVRAEDLMSGCKTKIKVECDCCHKICETDNRNYLISMKLHNGHYYCRSCCQKSKETLQKTKETLIERYGVDTLFKSEDIQQKIKDTNLHRYGVDNPFKSEEVRNKIKESFIARYGVEHPSKVESIIEKTKTTFAEKGVGQGFANKEILKKAQEALANSGKVLTSKPQRELFELLQEQYPEALECILNKPCSTLNLDIALNINGILIDIEVDGEYWHQDLQKDRKRDEVVKKYGYKILRIRYQHKLPDIQVICNGIKKLITTSHNFYQIEIKDNTNKQ